MDQRELKAGVTDADEDRRNFLKSCGKFAAITPPALAVLMSTTLRAQASDGRYRKPSHKHHFDD
jgi:hypothetical protein